MESWVWPAMVGISRRWLGLGAFAEKKSWFSNYPCYKIGGFLSISNPLCPVERKIEETAFGILSSLKSGSFRLKIQRFNHMVCIAQEETR